MHDYESITNRLSECGLSWYHARLTLFITQISNMYRREKPFSPKELPPVVYCLLDNFLIEYQQINNQLKRMGSSWNDPVIVDYFAKNAVNNRLTFKQWQELKEILAHTYIPF